ncbi:hypothetical protein BDN72DRAFT_965335 [Pluteus cervinus]|uniref:Uncharacterized protein n=1 Tax=Pluteus cervinus TaxID=181527 RepID=A0ACD3A629_9AGAR|nr:hypothetical protein BDN72DRAFT_965335 [Pluteus cervinus]
MQDLEHPFLPAELEREIFEIAARSLEPPTTKNCNDLLLVAKRAQIWVEPIIYETVAYSNRGSNELQCFPVPQSQRHHIRNLLLSGPIDINFVYSLLRECHNVTNLALWCPVSPTTLEIIITLPLHTLSGNFHGLTVPNHLPLFDTGIRYTISPFKTVTHLEFSNYCSDWDMCAELADLPGLTHLSFNNDVPSAVLKGALEACLGLKVLISLGFHYSDRQLFVFSEKEKYSGLDDIRLVHLSQPASDVMSDWLEEANGGVSFWKVADKVVQERIAKAQITSAA